MNFHRQGFPIASWLFWSSVAAMIYLVYNTTVRESTSLREIESRAMRGLESEFEGLAPESMVTIEVEPRQTVVELSAKENRSLSENRREPRVGTSLSGSMQWLNDSIESLSEQLKRISDKLENTEDKSLVEAEVKRAFREAFVGEPKAEPPAEVVEDSKDFEALASEASRPSDQGDVPVLGDGIPEWIRQRVIDEDRILIPLESSMHGSLEECRSELATKLTSEVRKVIDDHVLHRVSSDSLDGLTSEYIHEHLIDRRLEFDNYQERPSGNFHQLWVRLDIDKNEIDQIREWEREVTTTKRVWILSGLSLGFLGAFAGLSEVFQWMSSRERRRTRPLDIA